MKNPRMSKKMAQGGIQDEFTDVSMPLADADGMDEDSLKKFFSDMEEFVTFNEDAEFGNKSGKEFGYADTDEKLETVYFEFGKHKIDEDQRDKLAYNAQQAKLLLDEAKLDNPNAKLVVDGHACASAGTAAYNLALSEKRAKEVADALAAEGIDREDIKAVGRGTEMLIVKDGDRDAQYINRRVEMHVVSA